MTVARDLMTPDPKCVKEDQTLADAARMMRDLDVGALPICGNDDRLKGMVTDRDIVVKCIAEGGDPNTVTAGSLGEGKPITIGADDDIRDAQAGGDVRTGLGRGRRARIRICRRAGCGPVRRCRGCRCRGR